jgi:hypothetical protein
MKPKPVDRTLDIWWSKAVSKKYGGKCALCKRDGTQAHHIVKRRYKLTRWLVGNGVWLCQRCHTEIEIYPAKARAVDSMADESIALWGKYTLKQWCQSHYMTTNDFRADRLKELKTYVDG